MSGADVADIALATLADFLSSAIPGLKVNQEFPYATEKLVYPTLTISTNKPTRIPLMTYTDSVSSPDQNGQVVANEVVAEWDDTFQLDLWCKDKGQRKQFTEAIIAAFASQWPQPDGLSLPMPLHFNEICRYDIDTVQCIDDEASAQRQERREKITVLVNCREIRQRKYYAIKSVQATTVVGPDDAVMADSTYNQNETETDVF